MLKKKVFWWVFCTMLALPTFTFAQSERYIDKESMPYSPPNNLERYQVDYEVKNWTSVDENLVNQLDLSQIDDQRLVDQRVEVVDPNTGLTIIIYSATEAGQQKYQQRRRELPNRQSEER